MSVVDAVPVEALQEVLAGEHAAVYGYGVVGARLVGQPDEHSAVAGYDTHRARRAAVTALIIAAGAQPTPAAVAYELGGKVVSPAQARALAARIEQGVAATYADAVGAGTGQLRTTAAGWLTDAAVRAAAWSGAADTFPGLTAAGQ
jgi:Domain of unknown function (DUF4439)